MKKSRTITISSAVGEMHRQINPTSTTPSQEHLFDFDVAEINFFLAAEGKMLKIEGGVREIDPRWSLLLGSPPVTGSPALVYSYVMADLNQRETMLYLRGFLSGIKEERNVADATLQTMTDKFTALLKKGNKPS